MRTALVLSCLMVAALPACRTVRTVELAPTLEAAVAQTHRRGVRIERFGASALRNTTSLALSPRMLSYVPENGFARDSLPREQVKALTVHASGAEMPGRAIGMIVLPIALGVLVDFACCFSSGQTSGFGPLGVAVGFGSNFLFNPDRERVVYRAPER